MFKQTAIFYITKSYIFFASKNISLQKLDLKTLVANQEVLNIDAFVKSLSSFIVGLKVKNFKTLILIDESLTYEKEIKEKEITQQTLDQFIQELPFDSKELEISNIMVGTKNTLIATNKLIYQSLIKTLIQNNNEVQFVIPAKYVSLRETDLQSLRFSDLLNKFTSSDKIKNVSFKQDGINVSEDVRKNSMVAQTDLQPPEQIQNNSIKSEQSLPKPNKHPIFSNYLIISSICLAVVGLILYLAVKGLTR